MSKKFQPAFPWEEKNHDGTTYQQFSGMTLRDYFAAQAMQSVMQNMKMDSIAELRGAVAAIAFAVSEAMLAERAK